MNNVMDVFNAKCFLLLLLMVFTSIPSFSSAAHKGEKMEPLYDIDEAAYLEPQIIQSRLRNLSIFPVPQDNSVGTNDIDNAITVISFSNGRMHYEEYFRKVVNDMGGGGIYLPVISPDLIGFGQVRRFMIFDFKRKIHREFRVEMSIEKYIEKIAIADARQRHFIFEIKKFNPRSNNHTDHIKTLQLIDLGGEKLDLIKEIPKEVGVVWSVVADKNFLYRRKTQELQVLDKNLEPAQHPLADLIRQSRGGLDFSVIHAHPYLPFGILEGGKKEEVSVSWKRGKDSSPTSLFGVGTTVTGFSFSPNGEWVVLKKESLNASKTYLMPVSEKYPHYLGSPILLCNDSFAASNSAWTTNPISFVGTSLDKFYRWELTNHAHPESDKATFHDFVVERDLEKLTKEKRQGLGDKR